MTNFGGASVSVVAIATNTVLPSILVGNNPYGIAITPDGKYAYVVNNVDGTVSVIAIATNTVVGSPIHVGSGPQYIAITPDGSFVYVSNSSTTTVSVIATATNTVIATIPGFSAPWGIAIISIPPAIGLTGKQQTNNAGTFSELFNHLKWESSPAPGLAGYTLTFLKKGELKTVTLKASATSYKDHDQSSEAVTYTLTAFNAQGIYSAPVTVTVGGD